MKNKKNLSNHRLDFSEDQNGLHNDSLHNDSIEEEFLKTHDIVNLLQVLVADVESLKNDMVKTFNISSKWQQRFDNLIELFEEQAKYYEAGLEARLKFKNTAFTYNSVSKLIYECVEFYRQEAKNRGIDFKIHLEQFKPHHGKHQVLEICMDPMTLRQAFLNAIDNTVKYSFSGTDSHSRWVGISGKFLTKHNKQGYEFEISNLGIGIEPDELERVFAEGYQGRLREGEVRSGHGVGLNIVKKTINQHQGHVFIQSFPQKQSAWLTRLYIWLPIHNPDRCGEKKL